MASNTNFDDLPCSSLAQILKSKGITHSKKRKQELVELCRNAEDLHLPTGDNSDDENASVSRRTVKGKVYPNPNYDSGFAWKKNMRDMPAIDAFDVTSFLLNVCGWSKERVKRRKSDNGYQLHCSGHIHDVEMCQIEHELFFIRGKCVPETRQSSDPYKPWVLVERSGSVKSAECTCVAGDGSCKHVVALLFGLTDMVLSMEDRATIGVTDTAAYWDKPRKVCRPMVVDDLDIRTDVSITKKARPSENSGYFPVKPESLEQKKIEGDIVKLLKQTKTPAVGLYTLSDSDESDDDLTMSVENCPPNIIDLITKHGQENITNVVTDEYIDNVVDITKGQSSNAMWKYQRTGRLTASNFYNAFHYKGDREDNYIVKNILGKYQFTSKAVEYGKKFEPIAREKYFECLSKIHTSFQCSETGVFVFKDYPYLAASPDGIVNCKCCPRGLLEIKCPYSLQNESTQVAMSKCSSCELINGEYKLKKNLSSPYYVQMLGQMGICNYSFCDFVLFTQEDLYIERVLFDVQQWQTLLARLQEFYVKFVMPKLE